MTILSHTNLDLFSTSLVRQGGNEFGLVKTPAGLQLAVLGKVIPEGFTGEPSQVEGQTLVLGPLNSQNAAALRKSLTWLQPRPLGLKTSAGLGDRIGLATPGHVRAVRAAQGRIAPIFAQQSIREMARTIRTPQEVMDAATWGMFQEGWREGTGADADHLKTFADIDACLSAGYTFYTIDPGAHVDNRAEFASIGDLEELAAALPEDIQPRASGLTGTSMDIEGLKIHFNGTTLSRAAVKYGRAVLHVSQMYQHLKASAGSRPFELEVSVDETDQPTSHAEHVYVASELRRLGVEWVSLAPRYVGRFEKAVDYIGDLGDFERDFAGHSAIARRFGPYKLSLHSGSDKFSIYAIAARLSEGMVHLKTAGTSYLEALRTIGTVDEDLFREIYKFARARYDTDKASYHVSAQVARTPDPDRVKNYPDLLNHFDAREVLHITFGSVLTEKKPDGGRMFYDRIVRVLNDHAEAYAANLERHFINHLTPFLRTN